MVFPAAALENLLAMALLIRLGDRGPSVAQLQGALNSAGGSARPRLVEDGIFGPATQARLMEFQRSRGLAPDGIAGPLTMAALGLSGSPSPNGDPQSKTNLVSEIFRNDNRLQRCLVDNAAHIVPGTQGQFVQLIQFAILTLHGGVIPGSELNTFVYGPATADLILKYKTKNNIINTAYQKTPDNIVGKMTISKLDDDMFEVERQERLRTQRIANRARG